MDIHVLIRLEEIHRRNFMRVASFIHKCLTQTTKNHRSANKIHSRVCPVAIATAAYTYICEKRMCAMLLSTFNPWPYIHTYVDRIYVDRIQALLLQHSPPTATQPFLRFSPSAKFSSYPILKVHGLLTAGSANYTKLKEQPMWMTDNTF